MGLSPVNIFVMGAVGEKTPCRQNLDHWKIVILDCYSLKVEYYKFANPVSAMYGHAEFKLPPGCYIAIGFSEKGSGSTFPVMFQVCCDKMACVKLMRTGEKYPLTLARETIGRLARENLIDPKLEQSALKVLNEILAKLPKDEINFEIPSQKVTQQKKK